MSNIELGTPTTLVIKKHLPGLEKLLIDFCGEKGYCHIALSHKLDPLMGYSGYISIETPLSWCTFKELVEKIDSLEEIRLL